MSLAVVISLALLWQSWYCHNVIYHLSDGGRLLMIAHNLFTTSLYQLVDIEVIKKEKKNQCFSTWPLVVLYMLTFAACQSALILEWHLETMLSGGEHIHADN